MAVCGGWRQGRWLRGGAARALSSGAAAAPSSVTPTKLQIVELEGTNPAINLATEEWCAAW